MTRTSKIVASITVLTLVGLITMSLRGSNPTVQVATTKVGAAHQDVDETTPIRATEIYTIRTPEEIKHDKLVGALGIYRGTFERINAERFVSHGWQKDIRPADARDEYAVARTMENLQSILDDLKGLSIEEQVAPETDALRHEIQAAMKDDVILELAYAEKSNNIYAIRPFLKYSELLGMQPEEFGKTKEQIRALTIKCAKNTVEFSGPYAKLGSDNSILQDALGIIREFGLNVEQLQLSKDDKDVLKIYL